MEKRISATRAVRDFSEILNTIKLKAFIILLKEVENPSLL